MIQHVCACAYMYYIQSARTSSRYRLYQEFVMTHFPITDSCLYTLLQAHYGYMG